MTTGAPPRAAVDQHREALELARRRTALQVDTVAHAVTGLDDTVGWSRLTELGTASTVRAQSGAVTATTELLSATLDAAGVAADLADALPGIEPGRLASGRDVRGMFDRTRDIVQARMAGGAAFPEALDASANVLTAIASSEPHRIARDGQFNVGLSDNRFDKFRRVTVGTSCAFCRMLATRGAVYLTAESAGQSRRYHYKCDCYVELVVDPAAIEASKSTSEDWRNAVRDRERLRAADVRREFADLTDDDLARLAGNRPDSALSADLLAERARRADDWVSVPGEEWAARRWEKWLAENGPDPEMEAALIPRWSKQRVIERSDGSRIVAIDESATDDFMRTVADEVDAIRARLPEWHRVPVQVDLDSHLGADGYAGGAGYIHLNPTNTFNRPDYRRYVITHELGHTLTLDMPAERAVKARLFAEWSGGKPPLTGQRMGDSYLFENAEEMYAEVFAEWFEGDRTLPIVRAYADQFGWERATRGAP